MTLLQKLKRRGTTTAVAVACSAWLGCGGCSLKHEEHEAVVVEKVYTPSSTQTGVGPVVGGKGNGGVVITTSSEPEKWTVIVQTDRETIAIATTAARWASVNKGDHVQVDFGYGKHTGWRWTEDLL